MVATPTRLFCELLRTIVDLLERGDHEAAAAKAAEIPGLVAGLPAEMPESDAKEAQQLMERYAELGERLRQETAASMTKLGAARRAASYGRAAHRP